MIINIITGASRGIGKEISLKMSNLDHDFLLIGGKNKFSPEILKKKNITVKQIDFKKPNNVYLEVKKFLREKKSSQINLILCASQLGSFTSNKLEFELSEISDVLNINLLGNISIIKAVSEVSNSKSRLRIVFFAGGGAAYAYPDFFGYSLSKAATVRAVENLGIMLKKITKDSSIIALAPGAVKTDMLSKVLKHGAFVKTVTDISEPVSFVDSFINDKIPSLEINGMFIHVRDELSKIRSKKDFNQDIFKLRRVQ